MKNSTAKIIWTKIDEAPALATYSFLPVLRAFLKDTSIEIETKDISLVSRILATFPDKLNDAQKIPDHLAKLNELTLEPETNIIKLPNISASIPQLKDAIKELKEHGYDIPDYPEDPKTDEEKSIHTRYAKVLGSAVNPVLRQGNSDRRAPISVKQYAKQHPKSMGLPLQPWDANSKSHVAHMNDGDFFANEKSVCLENDTALSIKLTGNDGKEIILKDKLDALKDEIIDATFLSKNKLRSFYKEQIEDAKKQDVLLSLHLKATMMKVSDPILFGHAVTVYFEEALTKHQSTLNEIGFNPNNGLGDLYTKIVGLPEEKQNEIKSDLEATYKKSAKLAMVNSSKGITNLHQPNDIIVDASMPVVVRDSGKMWGEDDKLHDTKAMVPDRCYATMYQIVLEDCKKNGAFDRATMGSVANVGLMAQKAEEYGSHPTTFEIPNNGKLQVLDADNNTLVEQNVEKGDVWRMSRVKDIPIQDWVKLAVTRAQATKSPTVFWLDEKRAHDVQIIKKVNKYLKDHKTDGLEFHIMSPDDAMNFSLQRIRESKDTISVTGNVLRDYLTDLFPILELGTSAKMLSIVPLLAGGGLFETGAGGSAPKHVDQFLKEGHLRWDSLGEYSALSASLEHISVTFENKKAQLLSDTLELGISKFLDNSKSPSRKVHELDNRGSHFYLFLYWAQALAKQTQDDELQNKFTKIAKDLETNEETIIKELNEAQGNPVDIGGYFDMDDAKTSKAMRPSKTFNSIIDAV